MGRAHTCIRTGNLRVELFPPDTQLELQLVERRTWCNKGALNSLNKLPQPIERKKVAHLLFASCVKSASKPGFKRDQFLIREVREVAVVDLGRCTTLRVQGVNQQI